MLTNLDNKTSHSHKQFLKQGLPNSYLLDELLLLLDDDELLDVMHRHSTASTGSQLSALVKGPLHSISASKFGGSIVYLRSALQLYFFSSSCIKVLNPAHCFSPPAVNSSLLVNVYGTLILIHSPNIKEEQKLLPWEPSSCCYYFGLLSWSLPQV